MLPLDKRRAMEQIVASAMPRWTVTIVRPAGLVWKREVAGTTIASASMQGLSECLRELPKADRGTIIELRCVRVEAEGVAL
jgi:hypothetical protein